MANPTRAYVDAMVRDKLHAGGGTCGDNRSCGV